MPLSSNRGYTLSTQLFTADIDLDHLDKVCLSGFFTEQLLLFFSHPLPLLSFLGGSHYLGSPFQEAAHIWGKRSHAQSPQGQHPPKLFGSLLHRRFAYSPNVMHFYQYFYAGSFYFLQIQEPYWCFWEPRNILLQLLRCMKLPKHQRVGKKPMIIFFYCGYILTKDLLYTQTLGLPWWLRCYRICLQCRRPGFNPWVGKIPWRRAWQSMPVLVPAEFHGQRSFAGYSPWGRRESDTTGRLIHTDLTELQDK